MFWHLFISWIKPIRAPDKQAKMVLLKNSFLPRYSRKIRLRAVLACAKSEIFIFENSKLAHTARSQPKKIYFQKSQFPRNIGSILWYFKKKSKISENLKLPYTAQSWQLNLPQIQKSLTLRGVRLRAVSRSVSLRGVCREQFCFCRPLLALNENIKCFIKYWWTFAT